MYDWFDALLAGIAEQVALEAGVAPPIWAFETPPVAERWGVSRSPRRAQR